MFASMSHKKDAMLIWVKLSAQTLLRKPTEGYLDSFPSLTLNTIKPKLIIHASHSSRLSAINRHASMV